MEASSGSIRKLSPTRYFRWFEAASVIVASVTLVWLVADVIVGCARAHPGWLPLLGAMLAAYVLSDFLAGVVHFLGDSFGSIDTPWIGLTFVLPFRSHHVHPEDICAHDFVATNGNNATATLALLLPTVLRWPTREGGSSALLGAFVATLCAFLFLTNQIHKWAHEAEPPRVVRALQRAGLLLSSERHLAHHRPPYVGGYCVTSGLCNRPLDAVDFFPRLESVLRLLLRLPRRSE